MPDHGHPHDAHDDVHDGAHDGAVDHAEGGAPLALSRRSFLVAAGFGAAGTLAACGRAPVETATPFLRQPEEVVAGRAT